MNKTNFVGTEHFKKEPLNVDGFGGAYLREMTVAEDLDFSKKAIKARKLNDDKAANEKDRKDANVACNYALIAYRLCDEKGNRIFNNIEEVGDMRPAVFSKVLDKAIEFGSRDA